MKLAKNFYLRDDVVQISRELLGKAVYTCINGQVTSGIIVETEAYCGRNDRACHAFGKRTPRTEIMYAEGGVAYIYLCYGIYHLLNIVTNKKQLADAVLIRAIQPVDGIEYMLTRRGFDALNYKLTAGPGVLSIALGITTQHYGEDLSGKSIWLEDHQQVIVDDDILCSPRVGVGYAGEDAIRPWRFRIKNNPWCSKAK